MKPEVPFSGAAPPEMIRSETRWFSSAARSVAPPGGFVLYSTGPCKFELAGEPLYFTPAFGTSCAVALNGCDA